MPEVKIVDQHLLPLSPFLIPNLKHPVCSVVWNKKQRGRWENIARELKAQKAESNSTVIRLLKYFLKCTKSVSLKLNRVEDGEGNGTPLQYSCLENPMNGGAW